MGPLHIGHACNDFINLKMTLTAETKKEGKTIMLIKGLLLSLLYWPWFCMKFGCGSSPALSGSITVPWMHFKVTNDLAIVFPLLFIFSYIHKRC